MLDLRGGREKVQYYRPVREKTHAQSLSFRRYCNSAKSQQGLGLCSSPVVSRTS